MPWLFPSIGHAARENGPGQRPKRSPVSSCGEGICTDGAKIGGVGQVYADHDTGQPNWVTVKTGLFDTRESFVPLEGVRVAPSTRDADNGLRTP